MQCYIVILVGTETQIGINLELVTHSWMDRFELNRGTLEGKRRLGATSTHRPHGFRHHCILAVRGLGSQN